MINYKEGDWFAVPLCEGGGYALGIVARANSRGVLLGYFFEPRYADMPTLAEVAGLRPEKAILVGVFGHLGLKTSKWSILGRLETWDRSAWPMPTFVRYEELTGRSFKVFYDPDDPNRMMREEVMPAGEAEQGPKDGMMGANFVENLLDELIPLRAR